MDDYRGGFLFMVVTVALITAAIVVGIGLVSNVVSSGRCATEGQRYGLRSHWTMFYGCYLRLPGGHWVTDSNYQAFQRVYR